MAKMFDDMRLWWQDAPAKSRYGVFAGFVLVLVIFIFGLIWMLSTNYQVLFREMDPKDAAMLAKELDRMKVNYKIADDGTTLLVNEASVRKVRLQLMAKDLPLNGTVGFELFNNNEFGMTEFAQRINLQRALQGELARTIMADDEIKYARVHLVLPESNLFRRGQTKPKASVTVILKPGKELSQAQVQGIRRLVAASVAEMDPGSVVVLNQAGVTLSRGSTDEADEVESGRLDAKKQVEHYLVSKIVAVLDRTFGQGNSIVSVDVQLNADHIKTTKENYLPAGHGNLSSGIIQRERHSSHSSNTATGTDQTDQSGDSTEQENSEVDYQVGRVIEQVVSNPGSVKRISVGVIIQHSADAEQLNRIRDVVAMAAGINNERGDEVVVHSIDDLVGHTAINSPVDLKMSLQPETGGTSHMDVKPAASAAKYKLYLPWAVVGMVSFFILLVLFWFFKQKTRHSVRRLTDAQRDAVLEDVQRWLNQPSEAIEGNH